MRQQAALEKRVLPIIEGLNLQWVGPQYFPQGKRSILRLFVDKPEGLTVEDCAQVSRQVNAVLNVEEPGLKEYTLEVSSPGLDRILFSGAQCQAQLGKKVSVRMVAPREGKRNFTGRLLSVEGEMIAISTESGEVSFVFGDLDEIRLVPEW